MARHVIMMLGAGVCVCLASTSSAADKLNFFDDEALSFEQKETASRAPAQREEEKLQEEETVRHTPPPLNQSAEVKATQRLPMAVSGDGRLEVLQVRQLTREERNTMKGSLKCSDPLAAEIRPVGRFKLALMRMLRVTAERLPQTVFWIFGRSGHCFDRRGEPFAQDLDQLDEAVRRAVRRGG